MAKTKTSKPRTRTRHSIGEWYGAGFELLTSADRQPMDWCALEIQAVYFSGQSMSNEFRMLAEGETEAMPYPAKHRRPDWRSSGPKRLLPQLQTKVTTINLSE
jgi:hypothetical protein